MSGNDDAPAPKKATAPARSSAASRLLALVPLAVAVLLAPLVMPRSAPPDAVPAPIVDLRVLARQADADHVLAAEAREKGLPDDLRVLGTALRTFHEAEMRDASAVELSEARQTVNDALRAARKTASMADFVRMRAVQLESFLAEVQKLRARGEESSELAALAGPFARRMRREGWCKGHALAMSDAVLRVLYKQMWNAVLGLEARPELAPSNDELRALYGFYIAHPRAPEATRDAIDAARRGARDKAACDALDSGERYAAETWRLERIARLSAVDPDYPADYARGVVLYRRGSYNESAQMFDRWLHDHPRGPWSLRAQNHLRAAHDAVAGAGRGAF